eukprot:TRINITY_DN1128_c0_g1_i4.p1 TRINITY_DN1128_c0_g1~~TRINITY_DN1128_c0_g1_i4.p1  ORF type:complete len:676 (+),score=63.45 TRINITY_DN1128_c0_g1_i4:73-2028(+)
MATEPSDNIRSRLLSPCKPVRHRRVKWTDTCDSTQSAFMVMARTERSFNEDLFADFPLVSNGKVVDGVAYKQNVEGIDILGSNVEKRDSFTHATAITLNSWVQLQAVLLCSAGAFFVNLYSQATFFTLTLSDIWTSGLPDGSGVLFATFVVWSIDLSIGLLLSWSMASTTWQAGLDAGDIIIRDDVDEDSVVSKREQWTTFISFVIMNALNVSDIVQRLPMIAHNYKRLALGAAIVVGRRQQHRMFFVGNRSTYEFQCENRRGHLSKVVLSIVSGLVLTGLKVWTFMYTKPNLGIIIITIGIPLAFIPFKVLDAVSLHRSRKAFREFLEGPEGIQSPDPNVRFISAKQLKRHFGVKSARSHELAKNDSIVNRVQHCASSAEHVADQVADWRGHAAGLHLQAAFQLMAQSMLPCFFDVQRLTSIHASQHGFPFSLGPFSLRAAEQMQSGQIEFQNTACTTWKLKKLPFCKLMTLFQESPLSKLPFPNGCCSSKNAINLTEQERKSAGIPLEAAYFAWSYPVSIDWSSVTTEREAAALVGETADVAFLFWGGYMYFDRHFKLVRVLAAVPCRAGELSDGLLGFGRPRPLDSGIRSALSRKETSQPATWLFPESQFHGATCVWVNPREMCEDGVVREVCEFGGFAFFPASETAR